MRYSVTFWRGRILFLSRMEDDMKRWSIYADGVLIGREYQSLEKARDRAYEYEYECVNQDEPCFPVMSIVEEEMS